MAVIIKKIELKNWFGYKGSYEENSFEFSDGVNIIVASNDIGKSKLHNAFRWLLTDRVILKDKNNKYDFFNIDLNSIKDILNHHIQTALKQEETCTIGVRLSFEEIVRGEKFNRTVTKELICKKDLERITVSNAKTKVEREERGNIRTAPDSFNDMIKKIIRPNLLDFFLVQGEALEHLTPLKGESLRTTINNLVNLNVLEKKCDLSIKFSKKMTELRQGIESFENRTNTQAHNNVFKKNELENKISKIENVDLLEVQNFIDEAEAIENQFATQAALIISRQELKNQIDKFNKNINTKKGEIKSEYNYFVSNYINKDFWLSKITDNLQETSNLIKFNQEISDFSALRRTELDDKLSPLEQKMLFALERDQPRPEILDQMIVLGKCYVCSNDINETSIKYMREKLIPYFKKELNHDDDELNKYDEVSGIYKKLNGYLNKFNSYNSNYFQPKIENIIIEETAIIDLEQNLQDFISENGLIEIDGSEQIDLATYNSSLKDKVSFTNNKKELEQKLLIYKQELSRITNITFNNSKSAKLLKAEDLEEFGKVIGKELIDVKRNAYETFSNDLQTITNIKWKAFSEDNKDLNEQSIKVDFELNNSNQPDFEIKVIDQFKNNLRQGGGASQTLRQLSVIFGLIEKAGGNVDYPFIADAPTTNMTATLSEHFFNFQLENASTQNILITKEFWDDRNGTLNEHGKNILHRVSETPNAKLFTITNGVSNTKLITEVKD
jgi:DNA sulfur modification protein DndD